MDAHNFVIIINGPTGVGKTNFADNVSASLSVEIVNCDMGQLYTPLTIGTAKPDWKSATVPHHMFDMIDAPELFSVAAYREKLKSVLQTIWDKKKIPLIIGGSSFYVSSLFFPPAQHEKPIQTFDYSDVADLWQKLYEIDPDRAKQIEPSDTYRIARALDIWQSTGIKPSQYTPNYDPIADYYFLWLIRDRDELYQRIDKRVLQMIKAGWVDEVRQLQDTEWQDFIRNKKLIGYNEVLEYLEGKTTHNEMVASIQQRTRNYAKRQITFWRMLKGKLTLALKSADSAHSSRCRIDEVNLTSVSVKQYIAGLKRMVVDLLDERKH